MKEQTLQKQKAIKSEDIEWERYQKELELAIENH